MARLVLVGNQQLFIDPPEAVDVPTQEGFMEACLALNLWLAQATVR